MPARSSDPPDVSEIHVAHYAWRSGRWSDGRFGDNVSLIPRAAKSRHLGSKWSRHFVFRAAGRDRSTRALGLTLAAHLVQRDRGSATVAKASNFPNECAAIRGYWKRWCRCVRIVSVFVCDLDRASVADQHRGSAMGPQHISTVIKPMALQQDGGVDQMKCRGNWCTAGAAVRLFTTAPDIDSAPPR
jgi:hypothetical protein